MPFRTALRWLARRVRRARARRKDRLASMRRVDERMVAFSQQLDESGVPYQTWRHTLPGPWRPGGLG